MRIQYVGGCAALLLSLGACRTAVDLSGCVDDVLNGPRPIAAERDKRFQGKVQKATAQCRGGDNAVKYLEFPWVDWGNYYGAGDASTNTSKTAHFRGVGGALIDLEYQRLELIKFNLFDNAGTFQQYVEGRDHVEGPALKVWDQMRLVPSDPDFAAVGGTGPQLCTGSLIRSRSVTGLCNDLRNPRMGSSGTLFARNVEFETTFPDAGLTELTKNRHGDRLSLMVPDPQVISRKLLTRAQTNPALCADGHGLPGFSNTANCDYKKAPFFNVLAAFWIQFMTHDWFSHLEEGHNAASYMKVGCASQKVNGVETPLSPADVARLGCRPDDAIDTSFVADDSAPAQFTHDGRTYMARDRKTYTNRSTAWWDASQIYGFNEVSRQRVKRDPADPARLLMVQVAGRTAEGDSQGYLPVLAASDPMNPEWAGQEATAFPDNWTIGLSFLHNVFAREHNQFVDEFRRRAKKKPTADSGLRDPARPKVKIRYEDVTPDELFEAARLVVSAEIAKIHTIEWTPQLLYDDPLFLGMNGNWGGLRAGQSVLSDALSTAIAKLGKASQAEIANGLYSALASVGPGIVGLGSHKKGWSISNPDHVNGGVNHFGSPFNFPQEFVSVYRLHSLVPDLIEYRQWDEPNPIRLKIPVVETFRGKATPSMHDRGLSNWGISFGRQRLGTLSLQNHPAFLQNLRMERLQSPTRQIDIVALDILRDRERGVPRFNEFRRQYGLRQFTSFDDFVDAHLPADSPEGVDQRHLAALMREVYGQHRCDASKRITTAQLNTDGTPITDCLGHPDGSMVDNVEDVDTVVGYLAESTRPHGFAISETQFVVFILNASRRLFSDRFLTSSFRPEFYTTLGIDWVNNNGPSVMLQPGSVNGRANQPVAPFKRVLLRVMPELRSELEPVANAFDPWARERGEYYSLEWKPRPGAETDDAFH